MSLTHHKIEEKYQKTLYKFRTIIAISVKIVWIPRALERHVMESDWRARALWLTDWYVRKTFLIGKIFQQQH